MLSSCDAARHERGRPFADGRYSNLALGVRRRSRDEAGNTPFLAAARALGCEIQVGTDMLFEQIPAILSSLAFATTTPTSFGPSRRSTIERVSP